MLFQVVWTASSQFKKGAGAPSAKSHTSGQSKLPNRKHQEHLEQQLLLDIVVQAYETQVLGNPEYRDMHEIMAEEQSRGNSNQPHVV